MNQWITENHYRRFPFALDTDLPFSDAVVVDFMTVLSTEFQLFETGGHVELDGVSVVLNTVTLYFSIVSSTKPGFFLVAIYSTTDAEDTRVVMQVLDPSLLPRSDLGYGIAFIGDPSELTGFTSIPSGIGQAIDSSTVRLSDTGHQTTIRVANKVRVEPSTCEETEGDPSVIILQNREAEVVVGCVEVTTEPVTTQERVIPTIKGNDTTPVAVPSPIVEHTRYPSTTVTTITTHDVTIEDEIPALPVDYDAVVDGAGALVADPLIEEGHNIELSGSLDTNMVRFDYVLGGGMGVDCEAVLGTPDLGRLAVDCLKSINGSHAADGNFELIAGDGILLVPDPSGHRVLVLINGQDLLRAAP